MINSPHIHLTIVPAGLKSANCVAVDIPTILYTGIPSQFLIQARDESHNNLETLLADEVGTDFSAVLSNSELEFEAKVSDSHFPGVYLVEI